MKDPLNVCISNREQYENGVFGGEWLKLPATAEQFQAALQSVGATLDNYFISEYETPVKGLTLEMVRSSNIDELNFMAARLEVLDPWQLDKLNAIAESPSYFERVGQLIDFPGNTDFFVLIPDVHNPAELGDYYLNKSQMVQMPDEWKGAVDVEKLGRLAAEKERGAFTEYGYLLESGDHWQPMFEGHIPDSYRVTNFPQQPTRPDPDKADLDTIATRAPAVATMRPPKQTQPQPVIPLVLNAENPAEKLKEITDKLEQGIKSIFDSEKYKNYLDVMSKFHNYSFNNTLLIFMQKPDAIHVAGFNTWKNKPFERPVKKGEKGIKIIAPAPFKVKKEMEKIDPQTQRPVIGRNGKPVVEEVEITVPAYKVVSVFDVSQTEGKELPTIGVDELTGSVDKYKDFFAALEKTSSFPIAFENIESGAKGYADYENKRIALQEGMSELQTLKTAIHEISHARLHDIDVNTPKDEQPRVDHHTREVQAESIAYTVCQHYGLDTSDYSFGYVAGWSSGRELTELKASLETIRAAAAELITEIDGHFAELQKDREQTAEHQPGHEEWSEPATAENAPDNPGVPSDDISAYLPQQTDTFSIYQLKHDDSTRDFRFEPLDRLYAAGLAVDPANYELAYTAPITADTDSLKKIFDKFNINRPEDFKGHSLSVSDIVTLNQGGKETAHYVDSFGFKEMPEFLKAAPERKPFNLQHTIGYLQQLHDNVMKADPNKTMGVAAYNMAIRRLERLSGAIPENQPLLKALINHTAESTDLSMLKERMTTAIREINPIETAEKSHEQNYNMIDGLVNNRPTVAELEAKAKAGERINLLDLANAVKAEKNTPARDTGKKPSIRAQIAEGKAQIAKDRPAPDRAKSKNAGLEV